MVPRPAYSWYDRNKLGMRLGSIPSPSHTGSKQRLGSPFHSSWGLGQPALNTSHTRSHSRVQGLDHSLIPDYVVQTSKVPWEVFGAMHVCSVKELMRPFSRMFRVPHAVGRCAPRGSPRHLFVSECGFRGSGFVAVATSLFALALSALGHSLHPWSPLRPSLSCCSVL